MGSAAHLCPGARGAGLRGQAAALRGHGARRGDTRGSRAGRAAPRGAGRAAGSAGDRHPTGPAPRLPLAARAEWAGLCKSQRPQIQAASRAGPLPPSPASPSRSSGALSPAGAFAESQSCPQQGVRSHQAGTARRGCVRSHAAATCPAVSFPGPRIFSILQPASRCNLHREKAQLDLFCGGTGLASLLKWAVCLSRVRACAAGPHCAAAAAPASLRQQRSVSSAGGLTHSQDGQGR